MKSVQIYKRILLSRVDFFRKMLQFRPSDIKMAKNMMDGPVFGRFATFFGTVRQQIAQKTVGRCDVHHVGRGGRVFLGACRGWRSLHSLRSVEMTVIDSFAITGGYPVCRYSMVKVRPSRLDFLRPSRPDRESRSGREESYQQLKVLKNRIFVDK